MRVRIGSPVPFLTPRRNRPDPNLTQRPKSVLRSSEQLKALPLAMLTREPLEARASVAKPSPLQYWPLTTK